MKNLIITAIISIMLLGAAWAKYESGSNDAASTVLYGTYNGSIVPLKVDSDGSVYPNMTDMTSDITTTGDISGATLKAGGTTGVSEIRLDANNTVIQSIGDRGIYVGDFNGANITSLNVDGWIYADNNVGIGTTAALASLQVGDGVPGRLVASRVDGSIYIQKDVEVNGAVYIGNINSGTAALAVRSRAVSSFPIDVYASDGSRLIGLYEKATGEGELLVYDASGVSTARITGRQSAYNYLGYNVGIGTTTALAALVVSTDATAITSTGAGDVYFKNDLEVDGQLYIVNSTTAGKALCLTNIGHLGYCREFTSGTACTCIGK